MPRVPDNWRRLVAIAVGVFLFAVPFLRYSPYGHAGEAHMDHEARYGGQLGMVGDHHIEVRRSGGRVEAYVSDARRHPVKPRRGWLSFGGAELVPLSWERYRLVADDVPRVDDIEVIVLLAGGTRLATTFDFAD